MESDASALSQLAGYLCTSAYLNNDASVNMLG